jgi:hypothetical protein
MGAKKMSLHQTGFQEVLMLAQLTGAYPRGAADRLPARRARRLRRQPAPSVKRRSKALPLALRRLADWGAEPRARARPLANDEAVTTPELALQAYEAGPPQRRGRLPHRRRALSRRGGLSDVHRTAHAGAAGARRAGPRAGARPRRDGRHCGSSAAARPASGCSSSRVRRASGWTPARAAEIDRALDLLEAGLAGDATAAQADPGFALPSAMSAAELAALTQPPAPGGSR